jgi:hypothetical protein
MDKLISGMILILIICIACLTSWAVAGTLSGLVKVDGVVAANMTVYGYTTGAGNIENVAYEFVETTDVDGLWSTTTAANTDYIIIVVDPDGVKASVPIIMTPE